MSSGEETAAGVVPAVDRGADEMLPPASQEPIPLVVSPLADTLAALSADAWAQPEEARPYLRYVLASSGATPLESEQERVALLWLVNFASQSPKIAAPVPLAELGAYRIDLRDYLWDRPIVVGGLTFYDAWEAIVDRSGLALPALPDDPLVALTGTSTAMLPARAFLTAASSGSLYYALTGAPRVEYDLEDRLGARAPDRDTEQLYNAGLGIENRHGYEGARRWLLPDGRGYWQGLRDSGRDDSLFIDPLYFSSSETDAIYPLPNGLPGFFIDRPAVNGPPQPPLTQLKAHVPNSADEIVADCIACHASGPLPVKDIMIESVRDNETLGGAALDDFLKHWPSQQQLDAIVAADSAAYRAILERTGSSVEFASALQTITRSYSGGLELADMAAALHAGETQLQALLPAGTTRLDVASFLAQFRALLCQIHPDASAASYYCP